MFSGIVEGTGIVTDLQPRTGGARLTVDAGPFAGGVQLGDSIAHNGCCLTVAALDGARLSYDLLEETLRATNLGEARPGMKINLERSLRADSRLGGHFVSGHVDAAGVITRWEPEGADWVLEMGVPAGGVRYLVPKGSVAVDGISLTVGRVTGDRFNVWIIPHTREVTALVERKVGDRVNLEYDLLAKYVERLLEHRAS